MFMWSVNCWTRGCNVHVVWNLNKRESLETFVNYHLYNKVLYFCSHAMLDFTPSSSGEAAVDLQVDYWMIPPLRADTPGEKGGSNYSVSSAQKKELKCSLKTMFRSMQVYRPLPLPALSFGSATGGILSHLTGSESFGVGNNTVSPAAGLSMIVVTREKKQKSEWNVLVAPCSDCIWIRTLLWLFLVTGYELELYSGFL